MTKMWDKDTEHQFFIEAFNFATSEQLFYVTN